METDEITISVVIPTRNRPDLVLRALESVARQIRPPNEVIVVDNGSDRAEIPDPEVRVVAAPVDLGVSQARNIGLALAQHDYVAFLDDDDAWDPGYLNAMSSCIAAAGRADCLYGSLRRISDRSPLPGKQGPLPSQSRRLLQKNPGFIGSNIVIQRELLQRLGGFDVQLPASEDVDLAIRLRSASASVQRVEQAVVLFDADRIAPRLSDQRTLLVGKWRLVRKHVSNPILWPIYWAEYAVRLMMAAQRA